MKKYKIGIGSVFRCNSGEVLFVNNITEKEIYCNIRSPNGLWVDEMMAGPIAPFNDFLNSNEAIQLPETIFETLIH